MWNHFFQYLGLGRLDVVPINWCKNCWRMRLYKLWECMLLEHLVQSFLGSQGIKLTMTADLSSIIMRTSILVSCNWTFSFDPATCLLSNTFHVRIDALVKFGGWSTISIIVFFFQQHSWKCHVLYFIVFCVAKSKV